MSQNQPWFRMYGDTVNNPKALRLSDSGFRGWVLLLCIASSHGRDGALPPMADLELHLRQKRQRIAALLAELVERDLFENVGGVFKPKNWDERQYKSDNSTKRVQKHRAKLSGNVSSNVSETPPEAEQNRNRAEQSARAGQSDLVEEALRADLREILGPTVDTARAADWIAKGYDPGMVKEVVRELRQRKPDVASLAYFEAALAERHGKRAQLPSERAAAVIDWDSTVKMFARQGVWSRHAGPEPGMTGCRAPADVLAKYEIDPATGTKIRKAG